MALLPLNKQHCQKNTEDYSLPESIKRIFGKYSQNTLIRNYTKIISVDFFAKSANFLLLPVFLVLMTQESYGLYMYLFNIINTFALIMNYGLYIPQSKLYHDLPGEKDKGTLFFTLNTILFGFTVSVVAVIFIFDVDLKIVPLLFKNPVNYHSYRLVVIAAIIATVYSYMLSNFFLTTQRITNLQKYNVSRIIFVNLLSIAMLKVLKQDTVLTRLQYVYYTEFFLVLVFGAAYMKAMTFKFDFRIAARSLLLALPVMISAVLGLFINFADKFVLEKIGGFKDLAIYNLGVTLAGIITTLFITFQNVWLPHFFKEKNIEANFKRTQGVILKLTLILVTLSFCIFIGVVVVIKLGIIKQEYAPVIGVLPILLFSQLCASLATLYNNYMILFEKTYIIILVGLPLAVLSVIGNYLLVPILGMYGAASSTLIVNFGYLMCYFLIVHLALIKKVRRENGA